MAFGYLAFRTGDGATNRLVSWQGTAATFADTTVQPPTTHAYAALTWHLNGRLGAGSGPVRVTPPSS